MLLSLPTATHEGHDTYIADEAIHPQCCCPMIYWLHASPCCSMIRPSCGPMLPHAVPLLFQCCPMLLHVISYCPMLPHAIYNVAVCAAAAHLCSSCSWCNSVRTLSLIYPTRSIRLWRSCFQTLNLIPEFNGISAHSILFFVVRKLYHDSLRYKVQSTMIHYGTQYIDEEF